MWDELAWACLLSDPSGHLLRPPSWGLRCRQAAGVWTSKGQSSPEFHCHCPSPCLEHLKGGCLPTASLPVGTRHGGRLFPQEEPNQKPFLSSGMGGGNRVWSLELLCGNLILQTDERPADLGGLPRSLGQLLSYRVKSLEPKVWKECLWLQVTANV